MGARIDRAGFIIAVIGMVLLAFGLFWWSFGAKTLIKYPAGVKEELEISGVFRRYSMIHGIAKLKRPQEVVYRARMRRRSLDDDYSARRAVLLESRTVELDGELAGISGNEENVYVFDRIDGRNLKSVTSTSMGKVVDRSGTVYPVFPVGASKKSYEVYCPETDSAFTVTFKRESTIEGLKVYVFEGSYEKRPLVRARRETRGLPGSTTFGNLKEELRLAGLPLDDIIRSAYPRLTEKEKDVLNDFPDSREVSLEYTVSLKWSAAVEPTTGTIVDARINRFDVFVGTGKKEFLPLLGVLASRADDPLVSTYMSELQQQQVLEQRRLCSTQERWSEGSVKLLAKRAKAKRVRILVVKTYVLYASIIAGAVLLIVGLVIRREGRHHAHEDVSS